MKNKSYIMVVEPNGMFKMVEFTELYTILSGLVVNKRNPEAQAYNNGIVDCIKVLQQYDKKTK